MTHPIITILLLTGFAAMFIGAAWGETSSCPSGTHGVITDKEVHRDWWITLTLDNTTVVKIHTTTHMNVGDKFSC